MMHAGPAAAIQSPGVTSLLSVPRLHVPGRVPSRAADRAREAAERVPPQDPFNPRVWPPWRMLLRVHWRDAVKAGIAGRLYRERHFLKVG